MFSQHIQTAATDQHDLNTGRGSRESTTGHHWQAKQTTDRLEHRGRILYYTTTAHTEEQTNTAPAVAVLRLTAYNVLRTAHGKGIPR